MRSDDDPSTHPKPRPKEPPKPKDFELRWECPNCGQNFFGAEPPDLCDFCQDFTTWRCVKKEQE